MRVPEISVAWSCRFDWGFPCNKWYFCEKRKRSGYRHVRPMFHISTGLIKTIIPIQASHIEVQCGATIPVANLSSICWLGTWISNERLSNLEDYYPIQGWHKELNRYLPNFRSHMTLSFLAQSIANLLPPITREIFHLTQLGDDMVGEYTHVALQHPFVSLRTPASEFMRSHRRPALHRCNAHCCKGCRARSFYCHPWSGQSTNLNKSSYSDARVTCRCPKVAMLMHSRLLHGVLLQYVLWFHGRSQIWDSVGINLWEKTCCRSFASAL